MQDGKKNHNTAMERALLGLLLTDQTAFLQFKAQLLPEYFYDGRNAAVLKSMHGLVDAGRFSGFEFSAISGRISTESFDANAYLWTLIDKLDAKPEDIFEMISDLKQLYTDRFLKDFGAVVGSGQFEKEAEPDERLAKAIEYLQAKADTALHSKRIGFIAERIAAKACDAASSGKPRALKSGLAMIDNLTGGFLPGEVIVIGGPPGSGKTSLAFQIAMALAHGGRPGTFFSQEMGDEQLTVREIARLTGLQGRAIENGPLNAASLGKVIDAARDLSDVPLDIDDQSELNHIQIKGRLYRQKRIEGLGFAVIDHLLLMGGTEKRQTDIDRVTANMRGIKVAAKSLGIPIFVLAQLVKEFSSGDWTKVRRPQVGDLLGGSGVEQNADIILFVHQQATLLERKPPFDTAKEEEKAEWGRAIEKAKERVGSEAYNVVDIILGKARGGRPTGTQRGFYHGPSTTFFDTVSSTSSLPLDYSAVTF